MARKPKELRKAALAVVKGMPDGFNGADIHMTLTIALASTMHLAPHSQREDLLLQTEEIILSLLEFFDAAHKPSDD